MKKLLTVLTLAFSTLIFSQKSKESNWILKLNSTQLVDVVSYPTLQVSVERKINPYFSVNAEFGYQLYDFNKQDITILNQKVLNLILKEEFMYSNSSIQELNPNEMNSMSDCSFFIVKMKVQIP